MAKHIQLKDTKGIGSAELRSPPQLENLDYQGWRALSIDESGVFCFMFDIEAGAVEYPLHASDKPWIAYVMQGSGTVYYGDQGGSKTDGITFSNGDFISFSENAQHGWLCDCATKIMLVRAS